MYKALFTLLLLLSSVAPSCAQWKKLYKFRTINGVVVYAIYFLPNSPTPTVGFATCDNGITFKTTDGGYSWHNALFDDGNGNHINVGGYSFSFKDSLVGWTNSFFPPYYYKTTDGGETWDTFANFYGGGLDVYYNPYTKLVFFANFSNDIMGFDENGTLIVPDKRIGNVGTLGISFSDSVHGICSPGTNKRRNLIYTSDGGLTWKESNFDENDSWGAIGVPGTKTFYLLTGAGWDISNLLYRSKDGGETWQKIYHYPTKDHDYFAVSSVLGFGRNNTLYLQTTHDNSEGMMMSTDSGFTWQSMCGPIGWAGSRFYAHDNYIYAADKDGNLWLNTTGIGSNSTPQITATAVSFGASCDPRDTVIRFTYFDSCSGTQAKLVSASLFGSNNFSLLAPYNTPRTIHPDDSLIVHYTPTTTQDTAKLHLRFHLGFIDVDTTIILLGSASLFQNVAFAMPRKDIFVTSADNFSVSLYPSKSLANIGLQRIDFDLEYYGDLVQYMGLTRQNNNSYTTIGQVTRNGKMETMPVSIVGADITLDSTQPIFSINFQAMITDTNASPLRFKNFRLNNDDPKFKQCNLSSTIADGTIQELPACKDTIISMYLKYRRVPIELFSITPNPTAGNVTITFGASTDQPITIQILDVLGHLISQRTISKVSTTNQEIFSLNQVSGVLYARISSGSEVVTGKFVKQ